MALALGLHIGADAAEIKQLRWRFQNRSQQFGGRDALSRNLQHCPGFFGERDRLQAAREDPAALGDFLAVIVIPRRPRQDEHPGALSV